MLRSPRFSWRSAITSVSSWVLILPGSVASTALFGSQVTMREGRLTLRTMSGRCSGDMRPISRVSVITRSAIRTFSMIVWASRRLS